MIFRSQENEVMIALPLLSIECAYTMQDSLKCYDQQSQLLAKRGLHLMMEAPLAVLPS